MSKCALCETLSKWWYNAPLCGETTPHQLVMESIGFVRMLCRWTIKHMNSLHFLLEFDDVVVGLLLSFWGRISGEARCRVIKECICGLCKCTWKVVNSHWLVWADKGPIVTMYLFELPSFGALHAFILLFFLKPHPGLPSVVEVLLCLCPGVWSVHFKVAVVGDGVCSWRIQWPAEVVQFDRLQKHLTNMCRLVIVLANCVSMHLIWGRKRTLSNQRCKCLLYSWSSIRLSWCSNYSPVVWAVESVEVTKKVVKDVCHRTVELVILVLP